MKSLARGAAFCLVLCLPAPAALAQPAASSAQPPAPQAQAEDDATSVTELVVRAAPLRPATDVPRFTPQQITVLRDYARANFSISLQNEGRNERAMVTGHGARQMSANPNAGAVGGPRTGVMATTAESAIEMASVSGAAEGRKRALYRQLERAADAAEKATTEADQAFKAWMADPSKRDELVAREKAREDAVRNMLQVREQTTEGVEAAETLQWARIVQIASQSSQRANGAPGEEQAQPGLTPEEQEAVFQAMDEREYRLAAEAASRNLKFENVTVRPILAEGRVTGVRVAGSISNKTDVNAKVPPFNLVFYDEKNEAFAGMVVQPDERGVPANGAKPFSLDVGMSGDARISRVALIFGHPTFRPRPTAAAPSAAAN